MNFLFRPVRHATPFCRLGRAGRRGLQAGLAAVLVQFPVFFGSLRAETAAPAVASAPPEAGLLLWLKPENIPADPHVSVWPNAAGDGGDAVQQDSRSRPARRADAVHGFPAVMFEANGQRLKLPDLRLPHETTVLMVAYDGDLSYSESVHRAVLAADNSPYRKEGDGYGIGYAYGEHLGMQVVLGDGKNWQHLRDIGTQLPRHAWEIVAFRKQGGDVELLRDGTVRASRVFDRPAGAHYHTGYLLGGDVNGRDYRGGIAELLIYDRPLSDGELRQAQAYLAGKYGLSTAPVPGRASSRDPRFFHHGALMYRNTYADQPYIVKLTETRWLAVVTASEKEENDPGRHMLTLHSDDAGRSWRAGGRVEPADEGREPSWGTLLKTPEGRVYCFYNIIRPAGEGVGVHYVFRYSDDGGLTWSPRHTLPVRETWHNKEFGRFNSWGVDPPLVVDGTVYIAFSKYGPDPERQGEGFLFRSPNLLTERDADRIVWEMLPEGEHGLRSPQIGTLQEEHNLVPLDGESLLCVLRTREGYAAEAYSEDAGRTWTGPEFMRYANGRKIKNPRACAMAWRLGNGRYLLWFHNHDGRNTPERNKNRNPVWLSAGTLRDGRVVWSQPEPALFTFAPVHNSGLSYPDLVEHDGRYYISATDKQSARLCEIDSRLLAGLFNQDELREIPQEGLWPEGRPFAPDLDDRGFTITVGGGLPADGPLWSATDGEGNGVVLQRGADGRVVAEYKDGHMAQPHRWATDEPVAADSVVSFIFDGAANWIYVVVDGVLCDGGEGRQFGWGPLPHQMRQLTPRAVVPTVKSGQAILHDRTLSVSETIGLHRALLDQRSGVIIPSQRERLHGLYPSVGMASDAVSANSP